MCLVVESANYVQWDLILHDETNAQKISPLKVKQSKQYLFRTTVVKAYIISQKMQKEIFYFDGLR